MASPYSASDWQAIRAGAASVEGTLRSAGVLLTMGGEPTFVPLRPEGDEWRTAALGPTKLGRARAMARALVERSVPGAVILETTGKHYPGEPLPRWALLVQRWADGRPLWSDHRLLREDTGPGSATDKDARRLLTAIAVGLGLREEQVLILRETEQTDGAVGGVLPLDRAGDAWITAPWQGAVERGGVTLLPGESVAGLRLPLSRLGATDLKRAMTVEARHGAITVFLPPLLLPDYAALLAVIEGAVARTRLGPVTLAGYAPPADSAVFTIGIASDPGVLELNLAPCDTWEDFDAQLAQVYGAATATGLCARKLQFNGRQVGTGGGAHLVFGGPAGLLSPFFAFPALLPSVIRYWQHHPALSYAFTGTYLGPSSQAPRIDESTFEALYELEIACAGAETLGSPRNLPLFDLLFRDLLMDRSGNTHRAEISVDKLWNPYAPNGRLGLVEFRAFETHPDRAVQSVVGLFVRAILARLCREPFRGSFIRWGGQLHDRFFLPSFVREDLRDICADLKHHGVTFSPEWLEPALDFRFPTAGQFTLEEAEHGPFAIEFRQALEAWPLLGEAPNAGTVSRTVDSSLDRLEARVSDASRLERGLLLVNGLPCEFRPTSDGGAACGIRYRAFQLTPSLQPHVPVHAPLLLEWVDLATLTVVAAARWHVWNPAHAPYPAPPADEAEAGRRRAERWQPWTATLGQQRFVPRIDFPPEGRHTLDLRRYPAQLR